MTLNDPPEVQRTNAKYHIILEWMSFGSASIFVDKSFLMFEMTDDHEPYRRAILGMGFLLTCRNHEPYKPHQEKHLTRR